MSEVIETNLSMTPETDVDKAFQTLVSLGKQRGYLTWEELNDSIPDEAVSPDKL